MHHRSSTMKICIVLCALTFAAAAPAGNLTPEQSTKLKDFHKECLDSSKVDAAVVAKARKGEFTEDGKLDSYFTCMFKKCDFIDDNGKLKTHVIKQKTPTNATVEDVNTAITSCAKVESEPKDKVAKLAYKCYLNESKIKLQVLPETA